MTNVHCGLCKSRQRQVYAHSPCFLVHFLISSHTFLHLRFFSFCVLSNWLFHHTWLMSCCPFHSWTLNHLKVRNYVGWPGKLPDEMQSAGTYTLLLKFHLSVMCCLQIMLFIHCGKVCFCCSARYLSVRVIKGFLNKPAVFRAVSPCRLLPSQSCEVNLNVQFRERACDLSKNDTWSTLLCWTLMTFMTRAVINVKEKHTRRFHTCRWFNVGKFNSMNPHLTLFKLAKWPIVPPRPSWAVLVCGRLHPSIHDLFCSLCSGWRKVKWSTTEV